MRKTALCLGLSLVIILGVCGEMVLFWILGFDWPTASFLGALVVGLASYHGFRKASRIEAPSE